MPSILWTSVLVQSTVNCPAPWSCYPLTSLFGLCSKVYNYPSFSSQCRNGHYGQIFLLYFIRLDNLSPKMKVSVPVCIWKLQPGLFVASSIPPVMASSLLTSLSAHIGTGHVLLWIMMLSKKFQAAYSEDIWTFYFVINLHIWDQNSFFPGTQNPSPSWVDLWLDIFIMSIPAFNCLKWIMWNLQASGVD